MIDLIRIFLIFSLILALLAAPVMIIVHTFCYQYSALEMFIMTIFFLAKFVWTIAVCCTKDRKSLKIMLVMITTISIILCLVEIKNLVTYEEDIRNDFVTLIKTYPNGTRPNEWRLLMAYNAMEIWRCCSIDYGSTAAERTYFHTRFVAECESSESPLRRYGVSIQSAEPCMNFVHSALEKLIAMSVFQSKSLQRYLEFNKLAAVGFLSIILTLSWYYLILLQRQQLRRNPPFQGIVVQPSNISMVHPSNTSIYEPNSYLPPPYSQVYNLESK